MSADAFSMGHKRLTSALNNASVKKTRKHRRVNAK